MTLRLAAFQHFCARFADAFLTSLNPLTYERGDALMAFEEENEVHEPAGNGARVTRTWIPKESLNWSPDGSLGCFVTFEGDGGKGGSSDQTKQFGPRPRISTTPPSPEAVAPPAASATPAGVCAPSEAPPAGPPIMSLDWIEPAVLDVLACHALSFNGDPETMWRWECADSCGVVHEHFPSRTEWREHVWDDLRDRLERASKPK